jgi:hypothetical protein
MEHRGIGIRDINRHKAVVGTGGTQRNMKKRYYDITQAQECSWNRWNAGRGTQKKRHK